MQNSYYSHHLTFYIVYIHVMHLIYHLFAYLSIFSLYIQRFRF